MPIDDARLTRDAPAFLCDEMLVRLGRWLRGAGYDTRLAEPGNSDRALLAIATAEDRLVLTSDRAMAQHSAAAGRLVVLTGTGVAEQATELARRCAVDWLHRPFTRCLVDNEELRPASDRQIQTAPPGARACGGPYLACPACGRLYWPGSHYRRMLRQLAAWRRDGGVPSVARSDRASRSA